MRTILLLVLLSVFSQQMLAQSWLPQADSLLQEDYGIYGLSIVNDTVVWAIASDQTTSGAVPAEHLIQVLRTTDGGVTWAQHPIPQAQGRISYDIQALNDTTAWITANDGGSGQGKALYRTIDGGETWTQQFSDINAGNWLRFFNEQEGVLISRLAIYTTSNGGETWDKVPNSNIPGYRSSEFLPFANGISGTNTCVVRDDHVWFGTTRGRIFRSTDKGHNWEVFDTELGSLAYISALAFRDTLIGVALDISTFPPRLAITYDGGQFWDTLRMDSLFITNIAFVEGMSCGLIGTSFQYVQPEDRVTAFSNDFGLSWTVIDSLKSHGAMQFLSPEIGWSSVGQIDSFGMPALYKWQAGIDFVQDCAVVTTEEVAKTSSVPAIQLYPNPFSSNLTVFSQQQDFLIKHIRIWDSMGRLVHQQQVQPNQQMELQLSHLPKGMYFLEAASRAEQVVKQLVKVE